MITEEPWGPGRTPIRELTQVDIAGVPQRLLLQLIHRLVGAYEDLHAQTQAVHHEVPENRVVIRQAGDPPGIAGLSYQEVMVAFAKMRDASMTLDMPILTATQEPTVEIVAAVVVDHRGRYNVVGYTDQKGEVDRQNLQALALEGAEWSDPDQDPEEPFCNERLSWIRARVPRPAGPEGVTTADVLSEPGPEGP